MENKQYVCVDCGEDCRESKYPHREINVGQNTDIANKSLAELIEEMWPS